MLLDDDPADWRERQPSLTRERIQAFNSLAMPTPMLVINGKKDGLFDLEGVKSSFAKLNACYVKAGVPDHCRTRFYETPHEFNAEMQAEAWVWLKRFV